MNHASVPATSVRAKWGYWHRRYSLSPSGELLSLIVSYGMVCVLLLLVVVDFLAKRSGRAFSAGQSAVPATLNFHLLLHTTFPRIPWKIRTSRRWHWPSTTSTLFGMKLSCKDDAIIDNKSHSDQAAMMINSILQ